MEAVERVLDVLVEGGFEEDTAVDLYAVILAFVIGFSALEQGRALSRGKFQDSSDPRHEEIEQRLDETILGLPRLQRVRERALGLFEPEQFDRTLKALIDVIEARSQK